MFKECFSSLLGCDFSCSLYTCEISFCFTKGKIYCLSNYCAVVFRPIDTKGHTHTIVKRYFSRQLRQRMALSSGGNLDRLIAPHIQAKEITLLDLYWFAILFACEIQIALAFLKYSLPEPDFENLFPCTSSTGGDRLKGTANCDDNKMKKKTQIL